MVRDEHGAGLRRRHRGRAGLDEVLPAGVTRLDERVEVVEYDPAWPALFAAERARIAAVLPGAAIEHIGSTAVPGLPAKPVIDIQVGVEDAARRAGPSRRSAL